MSVSDHLAAVFGRYDEAVMRPPERPAQAVPPAAWATLQDWCFEGAGPGGAPFGRPGALPSVQQRFAVAQWSGPDSVAEAWALMLDGSDQLDALSGRFNKLLLKLRVKLDDGCWWRHRQPRDPWDAGHLIDGDSASHQLQKQFLPRRATLLLAGAMAPSRLAANLAALQQRIPLFRHPVRVLCLAAAPLPDGLQPPRLSPPDHLAL